MADTIHYTKVETDAKIGDVKKFAVSGIVGDLDKVLASEIPSTGYYKYDVFKAKTYTNVTPNITVEQLELDKNYISVVVNNGLAYKIVIPKPDIKINSQSGIHSRITIEGQSNALGVAALSGLVNEDPFNTIGIDWTKPIERVFIWNPKTNNYEKLHIGVNNMASWDADYIDPSMSPTPYPTFGVEVGLAVSWLQTHMSGNLYIDKNVGDGKQAYWFLKSNSEYYQQKLDRKVLADTWLTDRGITVSEDGFIWVQGESDKGTPESEYLLILNQLVTERVTDGFIKDNTRIIITQIGTTSGGFSQNVANAKTTYVNSNKKAVLVDYPSYYNSDNIHLNHEGQINLGIRAALFMLYNNISDFNDINRSNLLDIKGGTLSFNKAFTILGSYINLKSEDINYKPLDYRALKKDNTRVDDYPFTCSILNIDVTGYDKLEYNAFPPVANQEVYCAVLGIKPDNSTVLLLSSLSVAATEARKLYIDLQGCTKVSISWQNVEYFSPVFTKVYSNGKNNVEVDIKELKQKTKDLEPESIDINTDLYQLGALRNNNVYEADTAQKTLMNIETEGYSQLSFNGYPSTVGASNVNLYATIVGIKRTGEVNVLEKSVPTTNTIVIDKKYDVSSYVKVSISWGNYGASLGSTPIIKLSSKSDFKESSIRSIDLTKNTYRLIESLTSNITLSVESSGSFGNINVFQFTGGGIMFSGDVVMDENSDVYDPTKINTIYTYCEYGVVRCLIEN